MFGLWAALFSGCYVLQQGAAMLGYLNQAVPLEALVEEPHTEEDALFVERVHSIRRFALAELGLERNENYTKYVEIDRPYLATVVSASAKDSFARHEWWFPVTGSVPYKGFFDEKDAFTEAESLKEKGLDVWVRRVEAFSTLGWFSDPLYSYMKAYPVHRLSELLIHEQLHATVYLKGESRFNEELAQFVGREGSRLYMEKTFGADSVEYKRMMDERADSAVYISFMRELVAELEGLYAEYADAFAEDAKAEVLRKKEEIIQAAQGKFEENYDELFLGESYRKLKLPVNNAFFELYRLYHTGGRYLEDFYEKSGEDLKLFVSAAKTLKAGGDVRSRFAEALGISGGLSGEAD
ncbi:MAG: aminopeptidase [Spirochaetales bacterium]|nr:aminopeptidase [Spirochaetales bacterium]